MDKYKALYTDWSYLQWKVFCGDFFVKDKSSKKIFQNCFESMIRYWSTEIELQEEINSL